MKMLSAWVSSNGLMPHGFCYQWKPALIWLHAISDTLIALAYFLIPVALMYFVRKRRDIPFGWMFVCFGVFIAACGATHVMEVWTLWAPAYWLSGGVKVITAIASLPTAVFLVRLMPKVLSLPSHEEMRAANEELNLRAVTLRKTEEQFSAILNHSPNLIFLKDVEGRYVLINKEYRKTFHFTREQIYGKKDIDVFPPDQAAVFRESDLRVLHARAPMEFEEVALHDDGPHTSIVQKFPLFDTRGEIYAICGFVTDITERKRAEERLREYEKAVEGLEEMIVVIDRQYRYQLANRAFLNYRGMQRDQFQGRLVPEILGQEVFHCTIKQKLDECFQGKVVKFELNYNYPKLGQRDLFLSYFPIEGPSGVDRVVCVLQDITERKRAEERLQRLSGRLLRSQDDERRRIARELHDSTGQNLVAMATLLGQLRSSSLSGGTRSRRLLSECKALADQCIREVRTLSYLLHPPVLEDAGLEHAIRDYVSGFIKRSGIQVKLELSSLIGRMTRDIELALFRVVQESLTNIHRHSGSQRAKIRIDRNPDLTMEISDLGQSNSAPAPRRQEKSRREGGVGIHSMQERVKLVGGRLEVDITSHGTIVRVTVPVGVDQT